MINLIDYIYMGNSIRLDESSNSPEKMLQQRLEVIKLPKINRYKQI